MFRILYSGPISVTIHIPLPPENSADPSATTKFIRAIRDLEALYASSPYFAAYVDVHLAMSPLLNAATALSESPEGGRQFNVWRNLARLFARTEFVMMLDVDFAVCTNWRMDIRSAVQRAGQSTAKGDGSSEGLPMDIVKKLRDGTAALVIPTFEYVRQDDGIDQRTFPQDKAVCCVHTCTHFGD